jgi:hypothetical protein
MATIFQYDPYIFLYPLISSNGILRFFFQQKDYFGAKAVFL